jgi:hypothetical protein
MAALSLSLHRSKTPARASFALTTRTEPPPLMPSLPTTIEQVKSLSKLQISPSLFSQTHLTKPLEKHRSTLSRSKTWKSPIYSLMIAFVFCLGFGLLWELSGFACKFLSFHFFGFMDNWAWWLGFWTFTMFCYYLPFGFEEIDSFSS